MTSQSTDAVQKNPQKETVGHALSPRSECAASQWRYEIKYGPDGEENYAWVYDEKNDLVCTAKTHHAIAIVNGAKARNSHAGMVKGLKPFAELADVCDYFGHGDDKRICRFTKDGVPHSGPTAGECRAARKALNAAANGLQP